MAEPLYAEAVLVAGGRIAAVGDIDELSRLAGRDCQTVNLNGHTLMPAFIDAHGHFTAYANSLLQPDLREVETVSEIGDILRRHIAERGIAKGEWVTACGYDNSRIKGALPDRKALDAAAPDNPVVLQHQSGHSGVMNSLALRLLGITPQTAPPEGGRIGVENGELTGFLEENAFIQALCRIPIPGESELKGALAAAQEKYASYGIATVQDGLANDHMLPLYERLCRENRLKLDLVAYMDPANSKGLACRFRQQMKRYRNHFKIGGYKIFLDGSPQGRTAWMIEPYAGAEDGYRGYPTLTDSAVQSAIARAIGEDMQLLAHCNGDAACRQFITLFRRAAGGGQKSAGIRPVIVHAQLITKSQLAQAAELGMIPSFFAAHVFYWGEEHIKNFGLERAGGISPAAFAERLGMPFTLHQDAPVILPDMLETVWCAANRETKSGRVLGEQQRISVLSALRAVTVNPAYQYFEEGSKGSLSAGKRADMVILSENLLDCRPDKLREIRVLETIKDGNSIFTAPL